MEHVKRGGISSLTLRCLAMGLMLCDHLWATILPMDILTWLGRLAFPIFAFLLAEGFRRTSDRKKYALRLLAFALLSEVPFDLMYSGRPVYPYHQNVLWTFLIAFGCMALCEAAGRKRAWLRWPVLAVSAAVGWLLGMVLMTDYYGFGVLTVLVFYLCPGRKWYHLAGQLIGLWWINWELLGGLYIPVELFGCRFELVQQGMAVLALVPIWLYRGRKGRGGKFVQYLGYGFYPIHMLALTALAWMGL